MRPLTTFVCLLVTYTAWSVAYYTPTLFVSCQSGSDASNDCRLASAPCATLLYALSQASNGDVILFVGNCTGINGEVGISVTFLGTGWNSSVIECLIGNYYSSSSNLATSCFGLPTGVSVSVVNLTIVNGFSPSGGAFYVESELTVDSCHVTGGVALNDGGALFIATGGMVTVMNSMFDSNTASKGGCGGAIFVEGGLTMINTTLSFNEATDGSGGGLHIAAQGVVNVSGSLFMANGEGSGQGYDVYSLGSTSIVTSSFYPYSSNNGGSDIGSITVYNGTLLLAESELLYSNLVAVNVYGGSTVNILSSTFVGCSNWAIQTTSSTGAIALGVYGSYFINNTNTAIIARCGTVIVEDSWFVGNVGANGGAAIFTEPTIQAVVAGSHFIANTSPDSNGGAIYAGGPMTIERCMFHRNYGACGGALYACGVVSLARSTFLANTATTGGAIDMIANLTIANCSFIANVATQGSGNWIVRGGAINLLHAYLNITDSSFDGNSANSGGALALGQGASDLTFLFARGVTALFNAALETGGALLACGTIMDIEDSLWVGNTGNPSFGTSASVLDVNECSVSFSGSFFACNNSHPLLDSRASNVTVNGDPFGVGECPTDTCAAPCSGMANCNVTTGICFDYADGCTLVGGPGANNCTGIVNGGYCDLFCSFGYCQQAYSVSGPCNTTTKTFEPTPSITCNELANICIPPTITNTLAPTCETLFGPELSCTYTCATEAQITTQNITSCDCTGGWSLPLPNCTYPTCAPLVVGNAASVVCTALNGTSQRCDVTCDEGYAIFQSEQSLVVSTSVVCHALAFNQSWSDPPTCSVVQCDLKPALGPNTTVSCNGNSYADVCNASCPSSWVANPPSATCSAQGLWNPQYLACLPASPPSPPPSPPPATPPPSSLPLSSPPSPQVSPAVTCSWWGSDVSGHCQVSTIVYVGGAVILTLALLIVCVVIARRRRARLAQNEEGRPLLSMANAPDPSGTRLNMSYAGDGTIAVRTVAGPGYSGAGPLELKIDVGTIPMFTMADLTMVGKLGEGGFASVYHVRGKADYTDMALKSFGIVQSADQIENFVREVSTMVHLRHPNCLTCLGVTVENNEMGLLSEFMPGGDLEGYLRRDPLLVEKYDVFFKICQGIAYLHKQGITHADIKPENVLLDGRGGVRISDFGLVGFKGIAYTPAYAAPEVVRGERPSPRSDMYALGVLILRAFSTRWRFPTDVASSRAMQPVALSGLPEALRELTGGCLETEPGVRPTSAQLLDLFQACAKP